MIFRWHVDSTPTWAIHSPDPQSQFEKHGISFDEAETAFDDDHALIIPDELHSDNEPREILIGYSTHRRLLFISFIQPAEYSIRIISARRANQLEGKRYEEEKRF